MPNRGRLAVRAAVFLVVAFFVGVFLAVVFLVGAFLVDVFLVGAFLVDAFLVGAFLVGAFLAVVFFAVVFFAATFFAGAFLAAVFFLVEDFLAEAFFAVVFLVAVFFAVVFFADDFDEVAFLAGAFFLEVVEPLTGFLPVDFFARDFAGAAFLAALALVLDVAALPDGLRPRAAGVTFLRVVAVFFAAIRSLQAIRVRVSRYHPPVVIRALGASQTALFSRFCAESPALEPEADGADHGVGKSGQGDRRRGFPGRVSVLCHDGRVDAAADVEFGREPHESRVCRSDQVGENPVRDRLVEGALVAV